MTEKEETLSKEEIAQIKIVLEEMKEILEENLLKMQKINKTLTKIYGRTALTVKKIKEMSAQKRPLTKWLDDLRVRTGK